MAKIKEQDTDDSGYFDDSNYKPIKSKDVFTFNEKAHVYKLNGIRLYGVTTVLGVIAKHGLIPWAANQTVAWIKENAPMVKNKNENVYLVNNKMLDEARKFHDKKKTSAADIGTTVHKAIEEWIKDKKEPELDEMGTKMFENFRQWATKNEIVFVASEQKLYSKTHWVAGTVDGLILWKGKKYVMDIKTYSGIYDRTPFLQMAGYAIMLEELGFKDITGSVIVRLGKDGTFDVHVNTNLEEEKNGFLAALTLFKTLQKFKK